MGRPLPHRLQGVPVAPTADLGLPCPGSAVPPAKQPCLSCDGEGTVEILPLDAVRPYCATCDDCDGSGYAKLPYCPTCESKLTVDGWCHDCDDWGSLVYVERIAPGRVAL